MSLFIITATRSTQDKSVKKTSKGSKRAASSKWMSSNTSSFIKRKSILPGINDDMSDKALA